MRQAEGTCTSKPTREELLDDDGQLPTHTHTYTYTHTHTTRREESRKHACMHRGGGSEHKDWHQRMYVQKRTRSRCGQQRQVCPRQRRIGLRT